MKKTLFVFFLFGLMISQSYAAELKLKMPNGLVSNAAYVQGDEAKPVILLLHGFLQTHHFSTVSRLLEGLSGEGYSVLSPTMSLGIPDRKKSLACEALHDHTMEDDLEELDVWINWLKDKGHKKIVLAGHSQGATTLLNFLLDRNKPEITKFIAISIIEVSMSRSRTENDRMLKELKNKIKNNSREPFISSLSFCVKYLGTPKSFISYQYWSPDKIIESLKQVKIPVKMIMGGSDNRLRNNWIRELKKAGKSLTVIEGANHFLDGFNEFDLLEVILSDLKI